MAKPSGSELPAPGSQFQSHRRGLGTGNSELGLPTADCVDSDVLVALIFGGSVILTGVSKLDHGTVARAAEGEASGGRASTPH